MTGYIVSFTVYTLAMTGIIFIAFIVAKKCMVTGMFSNKNDQFLSIESSLSIGPRKTLYVVKAGKEKFLISSDAEKNTFLTKLENDNSPDCENGNIELNEIDNDYIIPDFTENMVAKNSNKKSGIMHGIAEKLASERHF